MPALHEDLKRQHEVQRSSERSFGFVFCVVFVAISLFPLLGGGSPRWWALGVSAGFLVVALLSPKLLSPLNRVWHRFGLLIHRIVSPLVVLLMYLLGIVPTALILKLVGKDLLRIRRHPPGTSYWIRRDPKLSGTNSMRHQF